MMRIVRHIRRILGIIRSVPGHKGIIALQVVSGMTSFLGIPLLIPALQYMNDKTPAESAGMIQRWTESFFGLFNIAVTPNLLLVTISVLVVSGLLLNIYASILIHYTYLNMYADGSKKLFQNYLDVKWQWLVEHHSGEMSHALYTEISQWSNTAFCSLKILTSLIHFITFFILAVYISPLSAMFIGIVFFVLMVINVINAQTIKRYGLLRNDEQKVFSAFVNSAQQNKKFLKASLIHGFIILRFGQIINKVTHFAKRTALLQQLQALWIQAIVFLFLVLLIAFHQKLQLSFESLAVLLLVFMRLMPQLNVLASDYAMFNQALPVYDSVEQLFADLGSNREVHGKLPYREGSTIRLEDISFSYKKDKEILKNISFSIPSRSTVAIIGGSGGGKSTILDLILGFWKPSSGRLLYGDITNDEMDYSSLRKRTAYVSQETTLFNGSLWDNLVAANPSASEEEVKKVCRLVYLDGLIDELADGLQTEIGENGIQLSGGQRQRVALGRALLMKPDILILDEATSSLDFESEKIIQEAVNSLHQNLTIIVVAHRLSTVSGADFICVLERGEVCESGTFDQLINKKGRFSSLYSIQMVDVLRAKRYKED